MSAIRRSIFSSAVALAVFVGASIWIASASAATPAFIGSITEANGSPLKQPWGMTFDASGNLFLADVEAKVVDKFDSSNTFTAPVGAGEIPEAFGRDVAVNNTTGVVYVGESGHEEVFVFKPTGGNAYELIQTVKLGFYVYVAVDNSSGPHSGDVFVAGAPQHAEVRDYKTDGEGKLTTSSAIATPPGGFAPFGLNGESGLTVDGSTGKLYIAEAENEGVNEYSSSGVFEKKLTGVETPAGSFEPIDVAVEESTGNLYVVDAANAVVDEFSSSGTYIGQITGKSEIQPFGRPLGVAVSAENNVYVSDGAAVDIFGAEGGGGGEEEFPLTVTKKGSGEGTVTSSPAGINCGSTCSAEFAEGAEVTLTAGSEPGSSFAGWSGGCTGTGTCKVTIAAATEVEAEFSAEPVVELPLTVTKTGSGEGTVTSSPAGIDCGSTCSAEFAEGAEVTLTAAPKTGSSFAGWSGGGCTGTGTCKVTLAEATEVEAEFAALQTFTLTVTKAGSGEGTVTSSPAGINCGSTCAAPFGEGEEVTLTAAPKPKSAFAGWSGGGCTGTGTCKVTIAAATEVEAEFIEVTTFPLTVVKYGEGTVVSSPSGINCGTACFTETLEFEPGKVKLTETPATGSEFAGWIGCKATTPTTCEVDLSAEAEVSAAFVKAGKEGKQGTTGATGATGSQGPAGTSGAKGADGAAGSDGATGPAGAAGPAGSAGPAGPAGPQGPAGAAGKVQLVKCTTVKKGRKKVQRCTTQLVTGPVKFTAAAASTHAILARRGVVYAAGIARVSGGGRMSLRLKSQRRLRPGRYRLTLISGKGRHATVRTEAFTLR